MSDQVGIPAVTQARQLWDVRIPMRDGVELSADIHFPAAGPGGGPYPTLLQRSCYNNQLGEALARYLAGQGYAVVLNDVRGRNDSDGRFVPIHQEVDDGYDTVEWCAAQPWSTGRVGIFGGSYLGWTSWAAVKSRPPSLAAAWAAVTAGKFGQQEMWDHGCLLLPTLAWHNLTAGRSLQYNDAVDWHRVYWHLPLETMASEALGRDLPAWREWMAHPGIDDYWRQSLFADEDFAGIEIPVAHVGGWWDNNQLATIHFWKQADALAKAARDQFLFMGPYQHGTVGVGRSLGDVDFGDDAQVDSVSLMRSWFDRWVKQEQDAFPAERGRAWYFVTGTNEWRHEDGWPPPTTATALHLRSGGNAGTSPTDGWLDAEAPVDDVPDAYDYDPADPVIMLGGSWNTHRYTLVSGLGVPSDEDIAAAILPQDLEAREDVLVYTSAPLEEPVTIVGTPTMRLHASSDGPDTDWYVALTDLFPDGRRLPLASGRLRGRFRESLERETFLEPGVVHEFGIELSSLAHTVHPGHRLRLTVTSSDFPRHARNLNTDEPIGSATRMRTAHNTVHHEAGAASHLVLPVTAGTLPTGRPPA